MVTPTITRGSTTAAPHGSTSDTQGENPSPHRSEATDGTAARHGSHRPFPYVGNQKYLLGGRYGW